MLVTVIKSPVKLLEISSELLDVILVNIVNVAKIKIIDFYGYNQRNKTQRK